MKKMTGFQTVIKLEGDELNTVTNQEIVDFVKGSVLSEFEKKSIKGVDDDISIYLLDHTKASELLSNFDTYYEKCYDSKLANTESLESDSYGPFNLFYLSEQLRKKKLDKSVLFNKQSTDVYIICLVEAKTKKIDQAIRSICRVQDDTVVQGDYFKYIIN